MKITEDLEFKAQIIQRIAEREFSERTGTHSSDLIYCLNKQALRRLKPLPQTEHETLLFSLGWSTQRWLTGQEEEQEFEVDGIKVTPDMLIDVGEVKLGRVPTSHCWELKATYQSSTKPIEENLHWLRQCMNQCYVTDTTVAYLTRLEIMGTWKWVWHPKEETIQKYIAEFGEDWDKHPTLHAYRLEFTKAELKKNWEWMKGRKEQFEYILNFSAVAKQPVLLHPLTAVAPGQDWECGFCPYKGVDCKGAK